jgi:hypothetical protein
MNLDGARVFDADAYHCDTFSRRRERGIFASWKTRKHFNGSIYYIHLDTRQRAAIK